MPAVDRNKIVKRTRHWDQLGHKPTSEILHKNVRHTSYLAYQRPWRGSSRTASLGALGFRIAGQNKTLLGRAAQNRGGLLTLWAFHNVILFSSKNLTNQIS